MSSSSNTLCPLAFSKLQINSEGTLSVCCFTPSLLRDGDGNALHVDTTDLQSAWTGMDMQGIRSDMLAGRRSHHCLGCYAMEDNGQRSYRQLMLKHMAQGREAFDHIDPMSPRASDHPRFLYVKYGNTCNLKCVVCGPGSSTRWIEEHNEQGGDFTRELMDHLSGQGISITRDRLNRWLDGSGHVDRQIESMLPHLCELTISGGEPFITPELMGLMRRCVDGGHSRHIKLKLLTNGTKPIADLMDGLLNRFGDVMLWWSIDGTGDQFEYQRYPSDWEGVRRNAVEGRQAWMDAGVKGWMGINCTVSALNAMYLPRYDQEFADMGFTVNINLASHDAYSHVDLPLRVRRAMLDGLRAHDISATGVYDAEQWSNLVLDLERGGGRESCEAMSSRLARMDAIRGTSYAACFPEMARLLGMI